MLGFVVFGTLVVVLIVLWVQQFAALMHLKDSQFAGRYDKALWTVAFVAIFWLAPITFIVWRNSDHESEPIR
jgi:hypothetical protein